MAYRFFWNSQKGTRTPDNQDCGGIGLREGVTLIILADGASTKRGSGELAHALVKTIVDSFATATGLSSPEEVLAWLRQGHELLAPRFPLASASYVIDCIDDAGEGFCLHAGDCLLGYDDGHSSLAWLLRPHTLANPVEDVEIAAIAKDPVRHRLTRGFRAREFSGPTITPLAPFAGDMLLASDGFWADLDDDAQRQMIDGYHVQLAGNADDRSVMQIRHLPGERDHEIATADSGMTNLYMRTLNGRSLGSSDRNATSSATGMEEDSSR